MKTLLLMALSAVILALPAAAIEITPFKTANQQPTLQAFGFPAESSSSVVPTGRLALAVNQEIANQYLVESKGSEELTFDGESYRTTFTSRYGLADRYEVGFSLPYISYRGGVFDSFIRDWHDFFGMPQGGRESADSGAVNYTYRKDGRQKLALTRVGGGVGDISLTGGVQLYRNGDGRQRQDLALRAGLKLPTGESSGLRGSGSTDFSLALCGDWQGAVGSHGLGVYGSIGGLTMTDGKVLADQQRNYAGFATVGAGWSPASWIAFKVQLDSSTAVYRDSSLKALAGSTALLTTGGTLLFPGDYLLDIGVSEDIAVGTAPDIGLHLGLSKLF